MERLELEQLEASIHDLLRLIEHLKSENRSLLSERAALLERTEKARRRVEIMLGRLKALEQE
ncbi:MAG TPA: TIGR02449 family protein [Gammaproteobacteria bacterium]|nr:TIGR02449 family protein [Gammaproteobacteria bacterium]